MKTFLLALSMTLSLSAFAQDCKVHVNFGQTDKSEMITNRLLDKGYELVDSADEASFIASGYSTCSQAGETCEAVVYMKFVNQTGGVRTVKKSEPLFGVASSEKALKSALNSTPSCDSIQEDLRLSQQEMVEHHEF